MPSDERLKLTPVRGGRANSLFHILVRWPGEMSALRGAVNRPASCRLLVIGNRIAIRDGGVVASRDRRQAELRRYARLTYRR